MTENDWLASQFEQHRGHLRSVAYRMLGSLSEADDAVQEAWLRVSRAGADDVDNLGGWLTTVVARICLNVLRSRRTHREEPLDVRIPDPVVNRADSVDPEQAVMLADSIGLALLVVLETLAPAERLAFVLHDMFAVPFDDIAPIVGRSATATRQLASRARRRVQGSPAAVIDTDIHRQRQVVDAFFAAARSGDFDALVAVLDPDVTVRTDRGLRAGATLITRGPEAVAAQALTYSWAAESVVPVLVNGAAGVVVVRRGRPFAVMGFTVANGRVVEIDAVADPERLSGLDLSVLVD